MPTPPVTTKAPADAEVDAIETYEYNWPLDLTAKYVVVANPDGVVHICKSPV